MARIGHIWIDLMVIGIVSKYQNPVSDDRVNRVSYTTMGTVSPSPLLWGLVDLNVGDQEIGGVETLSVGVGFSVPKEAKKELGRLLRPAGAGDTKLLAYEKISISLSTEDKYCTI